MMEPGELINVIWLAADDGGASALALWMVGLFVLAISLAALEIFVPSGGILGGAAFLSALGAVGLGFRISPITGAAALGCVVVATPAVIWLGLQIFPNTPLGRRIILNEGMTEEEIREREEERAAQTAAITALIGARGVALTDMRPGGTIRIEGEDVEAFAETGFISAGSPIEVTSIAGRQIRVKAADADASHGV